MSKATMNDEIYRVATFVVTCALTFGIGNIARAEDARPAGLPPGAVKVSPCIPGMGEHWVNPKDRPLGPIYGVYKGKLVFTELMISQKAFAAGKSYDDLLKPLPGYKVDHVDFDFEPHGHPGYPIPHYDVHAFYVPHAEHVAFCTKR